MADEKSIAERGWTAVLAAIARIKPGLPHNEVCPVCGEPLIVEGITADGPVPQWLVHCPCGKANGALEGL